MGINNILRLFIPINYRPRSEGDNVLGSVRPSVCLSVRSLPLSWLNRVQQRAKRGHYQSEVFVCVLNNRADAVDRHLISIKINGALLIPIGH